MKNGKHQRCAIYTRKSTLEGLEQEFNSLDAQRVSCEAYIQSQTHEGWNLLPERYDDGGFSGASMERPAVKALVSDIEKGRIDIVVVYKVDRLTRSLIDFARLVELFDARQVSFVSVTQAFNTTSSMGRLTLNVLLSFAQFEREVTAERIRDKIRASKEKGMWMGGRPPLGYDIKDRSLIINADEAKQVNHIFERYLALGSVLKLMQDLKLQQIHSKCWVTQAGQKTGGNPFTRGALYILLQNPIYIGKIRHKELIHEGLHDGIVQQTLWDKVRGQLKSNRIERVNSTNARSPSLLSGLLEDADGASFKPSHCNKQGKRYRYYVGNNSSLPAHEIEKLVISELTAFLENQSSLSKLLQNNTASDITAMLAKASLLASRLKTNPDKAALKELMVKIVITPNQIDTHVNLNGLWRIICQSENHEADFDANDEVHVITCSVHLKRCGHGKKLILDSGKGRNLTVPRNNEPIKADPVLLRIIAQAHIWVEDLRAGQSYKAIAIQNNIDQRHVARTIRLAFLAPDIITAIFQGREPQNLTAERLLRLTDFPVDWQEQQKLLGFV